MSERVWKPSVTVAAVVEQDGKFLMVEEEAEEGIRFNQPAGHLEPGESLIQAAVRECLEETGYHFQPIDLVGIYQWTSSKNGVSYLRFAFRGKVLGHEPEQQLDDGIIAPRWQTPEQIRAGQEVHRSPLVLRCVEDCLAGTSFPLSSINFYS
ncbi:MAG: NUDIX hydrolase [Azovibrio sp.]